MQKSVFEDYDNASWPYHFTASAHFEEIHGGTPHDPNVAEGWLRAKLAPSEHVLMQMVAEIMAEQKLTKDEALKVAQELKHLNGFRRDEQGLYIEGRHVKAGLKEAALVAVSANKIESRGWGSTKKALKPFLAEHVVVVEDRIHLLKDGKPVKEPTDIHQRFCHTWQGSSIKYEEFVADCDIEFTVKSDWDFTERDWAMIWTTAQEQGLGAARSQGFGRYTITKWDAEVKVDGKKK